MERRRREPGQHLEQPIAAGVLITQVQDQMRIHIRTEKGGASEDELGECGIESEMRFAPETRNRGLIAVCSVAIPDPITNSEDTATR